MCGGNVGPTAASEGLRPGDIFADKYRLGYVVGAGGMGLVIAARHLQLDTKVALKILRPTMLVSQEAVVRFQREARAAARLASEYVARVLDFGASDAGAPYIVMEFLEGTDLQTWIRERGAMTVEQAVEFVLQASVAIAEAHAAGIIHRDLKPSNLFCTRRADGRLVVKVLDFGISKLEPSGGARSDLGMTRTNTVLGTPLYMSPEQIRSPKDIDARADLWALGVVLYELVTGSVPFEGETPTEIFLRIASVPPRPLREFRKDLPAGLETVIGKCLERDREHRYSDVAAFADGLQPFAPKRALALVEQIRDTVGASGEREVGQSSVVGSPLLG
jgi:eukaryotic-like serine/threonine-protein kinase